MQNPLQRKKLDERNKEIIALYPQLTLREIGEKYNLSHQRVEQIIKRSLNQQYLVKLK